MLPRLDTNRQYQFEIYDDGNLLPIELFSLESTDPSVLTITPTGLMTPLIQGSASIRAVRKDDNTISIIQEYSVDNIVGSNLAGVAKAYNIDAEFVYSPIRLTVGEQLQYLIYNQGVLIPSTLFTCSSSNVSIIQVDQNGLIEGNDVGSAILTATRSDGIEVKDVVIVDSLTQDFHKIAVQKRLIRPGIPPNAFTVVKETNNTNTQLINYTNNLVGDCILFAGRANVPGSTFPQWKFALWRDVAGYGRVVAESPWFNEWPEGEVITFIHPLIGLLEFLVEGGPVTNEQDIIRLRDEISLVPPEVHSNTSLEARGVVVWDPSEVLRAEAVYKPLEQWTEEERITFVNTGKRPFFYF